MHANLASYLLFSAVLIAPVAALVLGWRRTPLSLVQYLLWLAARALTIFLWRAQASGPLALPAGQGAILVCNHTSSVDPFFIQTLTTRKTYWMVAREFCEHPAFGWFLRICEVIPTRRGGIDTAATREAIRIASEGGIVGMLPEGRINMTDELLLPVRPGAALVALKARTMILPCYIRGAPYRWHAWSPFLMPARVTVHFGPPLDISEFFDREQEEGVLETVILRAMKAVASLSGERDFEPQIAGRHWKPSDAELEADRAAQRRRRRTIG